MNLKAAFTNPIGRPVLIEIIPVCLTDKTVLVLPQQEDRFSWHDDAVWVEWWTTDFDHPQDVVKFHLTSSGFGEPLFCHGTSWRTIDSTLIITYLAILPASVQVGRAIYPFFSEQAQLAHGTATRSPAGIEAGHVVLHALQHLAFLTWSSVIDIKIPGQLLDSLKPQVSGELPTDQNGLFCL